MSSPEPIYVPFFGILGASASMIFCGSVYFDALKILALGASFGTARSSMGISCMALRRPELLMKSLVPVIMAGIVAVYGLVVSVIISSKIGIDCTMERLSCYFIINYFLGPLAISVPVLAVVYAVLVLDMLLESSVMLEFEPSAKKSEYLWL